MVDAHSGRRPTDADLRDARQCGHRHGLRRHVRGAPGDVALARGTEHYLFADDADTEPQVVIHPGNRCTTLPARTCASTMSVGVRTWGNADDGAHRGVVCAYEGRSEVSSRLLDALPTVLVLRGDEWSHTVGRPARRGGRPRRTGPGGLPGPTAGPAADGRVAHVVRPRRQRADVVARRTGSGGGTVRCRLIYNNPDHPWTVANLAAAVGCSRALFARRFTDRVGEPPIAFLTSWRLALAADMLRVDRDHDRDRSPARSATARRSR